VPGVERLEPILVPCAGSFLESHHRRRGLPRAGICALPQRHLGLSAAQSRLRQAELRITAEREQLFLAVEPIFEAPQLRAVGPAEQIEAVAVGKLVVLCAFRCVAGFEFLESLWRYSAGCLRYYPRKYPQMQIDAVASGGIRRDALGLRDSA